MSGVLPASALSDALFPTDPSPVPQNGLERLSFSVSGVPRPGGSKRAFKLRNSDRVVVTDANPHVKEWRAQVVDAAVDVLPIGLRFSGPLAVRMDFYMPRPKGHYGTGRNAGVLKDSSPRWPSVKPDVLKLARAVEDALTNVVWQDDALIVREFLFKWYADDRAPGVEVQVDAL